jgi:hypothetical protein
MNEYQKTVTIEIDEFTANRIEKIATLGGFGDG